MLSVGMGVEVMMFLLTAFDRPAKEYNWEEVFPVLSTKDPEASVLNFMEVRAVA